MLYTLKTFIWHFGKDKTLGGRRRDQYVPGFKGKEEGTYWAEEGPNL